MKMEIERVVYETNCLGLICPDWYLVALNSKPDLIDSLANGCGSETSWTYHLVPDTIWGLNINPSTHIHDLLYTFPFQFETVAQGLAWKRKADYQFYMNVRKQINDYGGWFKKCRLSRLKKYMFALDCGGSEAFWANKKLPDDFFDYYENRPEFDNDVFIRYKEVWNEICNL
jgi:hypothetical protein